MGQQTKGSTVFENQPSAPFTGPLDYHIKKPNSRKQANVLFLGRNDILFTPASLKAELGHWIGAQFLREALQSKRKKPSAGICACRWLRFFLADYPKRARLITDMRLGYAEVEDGPVLLCFSQVS